MYVPTNLVQVGAVILAHTVLLEEITRLLHRDCEVHQVAKDSHLGWSLLPFLDEEETAYEERDSSKIIKSKEVVLAEKAFMSYHLDKGKTASFRGTGSGRGAAANRGAGRKGKGKGKGRGKSSLNSVSSGSVGKSGKPRTGGCHRCGGPHFVRACTVAVQKPAS